MSTTKKARVRPVKIPFRISYPITEYGTRGEVYSTIIVGEAIISGRCKVLPGLVGDTPAEFAADQAFDVQVEELHIEGINVLPFLNAFPEGKKLVERFTREAMTHCKQIYNQKMGF